MSVDAEVLVVGAGLAGATAARSLADRGRTVLLLDKGRGPGGRLSTRRVGAAGFDHGASVLQASGHAFAEWLDAEASAGRAARWPPGGGWVGQPGMNALVAGLLAGLDVRWSHAVAGLSFSNGSWCAVDGAGQPVAKARALVLAIPAPQARALLLAECDRHAPLAALCASLEQARYAPCWTGLAELDPDAAPAPDAPLYPDDGVIHDATREASKPGRSEVGHWVVRATAAWSVEHLELAPEAVVALLRSAFARAFAVDASAVRGFTAHRWRYAQPERGVDLAGCPSLALALAGDAVGWRAEAAVFPAERAWVSGGEAAASIDAALAGQANAPAPAQPKS